MEDNMTIPAIFVNHAADILGDTVYGLSGSKIAEYCVAYAIEYDVTIPYNRHPFPKVPNKRTALRENLKAFSAEQQYRIIKELCELDLFRGNKEVKDLKVKLITRYPRLAAEISSKEVNELLIEETIHWLQDYPESLKLYQEALDKFENDIYQRNLLDDLRLSLELLLQAINGNKKSLENQLNDIGNYMKTRRVSTEMINMLVKLIDYYTKYQNTYVKHDSTVNENEVEFIIELTSSFMKFIIRVV